MFEALKEKSFLDLIDVKVLSLIIMIFMVALYKLTILLFVLNQTWIRFFSNYQANISYTLLSNINASQNI